MWPGSANMNDYFKQKMMFIKLAVLVPKMKATLQFLKPWVNIVCLLTSLEAVG